MSAQMPPASAAVSIIGADRFRTPASFGLDYHDHVGAAFERDSPMEGLSTGIKALDRLLSGLKRKRVYVIGGATSMGKSALGAAIAFNVAEAHDPTAVHNPGGVVGLISMEMGGEEITGRMECCKAGIPVHKPGRGDITLEDFERLEAARVWSAGLPIHIDEYPSHDIDTVTAWARALKVHAGRLDLLVLDYLQYLDSRKGDPSRVEAVTAMMKGLKAIAIDLDIPVVILSQLSRDVEKREDKRPRNGDLSDASAVEKTADVVIFVYREHYYLRSREPEPGSDKHASWQASVDRCYGKADLIVDKHRGGPTGVVRIRFDDELTRFRDIDDGDAA